MQDYNINVNYNFSQDAKETNAISTYRTRKKTSLNQTREIKESSFNIGSLRKGAAVGLGLASKINTYVGELTENGVQQRNTQAVLTLAGIGLLGISNPIVAGIASTAYIANSAINYQIKQYKTNLSADFMRQLSGGTYNTRG